MKRLPKIILLLLFCFFIYLNTVYAKDNIENCYIEYNASEINNHDKSFNEILTKCYISDLSHLTGGSWSVVTNYSSHVRVNLNLEKLSFYNLNAVYKNIVGDTTTIMYSSPSSTDSYIYRIIYTFKADSSTSSGKCCRSLVNGKTNYTWDISNSSCNVVNGISDETTCVAKNNTNTTVKEDKEVCILTGKRYHWGKISSISAGSKEIEGLTKEECRNKMKEQKAADTAEGNAKVEEAMKNISATTTDTTVSDTGSNTNKDYVIKRVKTYNDTYNSKCTNCIRGTQRSDYFRSPVSNGDAQYDYYNVYKAYVTNDGTTSSEEVSAFCIDPGMKGPAASGITYHASDSITYQNNPKFVRAIYRLYSYWYNGEGRNQILSGFSGPGDANDYVDYVVNNVARLTIANFGGDNIKFGLYPSSDSLKNEKSFYETNDFKDRAGLSNGGAAGAYSLSTLRKVWQDIQNVASSDTTVPSSKDDSTYSSVKFDISQESHSIINNNNGFEASFTIKLTSTSDTNALDSITKEGKWNITVETDKGNTIAYYPSTVSDVIVEKFNDEGSERTGKFKVSLPSALVGLASDVKKIKVNFNISYKSRYSLDNILILTPVGQATTYQKFLTFLNGTVNRTQTLSLDAPGATKEECNPMFTLKCLPINSVSYLIEGTQSPEIFTTIMEGINTVGDLTDFIGNSIAILDKLKNNNLNPNDLLYIGSLAYNIADDLKVFTSIQTELANLLNSKELTDNKTAQRLKEALVRDVKVTESLKVVKTNGFACGLFNFSWCSKTIKETTSEEIVPDYSKDETKAFTDFVDLIIKAINVNGESHQSIKDDWKQILEVSQTKLNSTVSDKTSSFITTINNFVTSAKSKADLTNILNGLTKFGETLTNPDIFKEKLTLDNIKDTAKNLSSAVSGTLQTSASSVTNIIDQLKSMLSKIDPTKMDLSDVTDIVSLLKNASTTDWEKCIIDNKDPNGNEYNVQNQNKYCTISCKEDYAFKMPGNLGTYYAGKNMTTNLDNVYQATIGIAGQRTCVTTSIDNDSYVSDAYELKEKTLEQYNLFMQTYAAQEKMLTTKLGTSKPAYSQGIQDTLTIEFNKIKDEIAANAEEQFSNAMDVFVKTLIGEDKPVSDRKALKATIMKESTGLINELAGKAFAKFKAGDGLLETGDIKNLFEQKLDGYKKGLEKNFPVAVNAAIESFKNGINVIIENVGNSVGKDAIEAVGAVALSAACNAAPALQLIPYVGEAIYQGVKFVCDMYATISTTMADVIPKVSNATQGMIFGIYEPNSTSFQYEYSIYGFSNGNGATNCSSENVLDEGDEEYDVKALSANFACIRNTKGTQKQSSNNIFIPTLSKSGYVPGELHFGLSFDAIKLKRAIEQFSALTNELQKSKDALEGQLTVIGNTLEKFQKPSISSLASILVGAVTGKLGNQLEDGFGSVFKVLQDYLVGESSYSMSILTNTIDTALNATLNLMGAFNPYYNDLANINNKLLGYKKTYNDYRDELTKLATNMHDCTVWGNQFTFDPKLTFTYGYRNFGLTKSKTTEAINLEKVDSDLKQDEIFYYCDSDVKINEVQSLNTILSGRCTTSDGIIGAILSALLKDTAFSGVADFIKNNSSIVKTLVKNDQIKSFLEKTGVYDNLCTIFGENGCPVEDGDDALTTGIPGELVYKISSSASIQGTFDNFKNISFDDVKSGTIVARLIGAVSSNFTYGPAKLEDITYRNVGRVVRISRYGNPGVSISGVDMWRFIENMITYIANYSGLTSENVASRIYDAILSITGEGAQRFVYFRSSKPYFTYSNKGIYTTNANISSDSVPADYGDSALFDDKIISGTSGDKQPTGKTYPIALNTQAGLYYYKITINNIGQYYNNNFSLGRIVDDNGYISGTDENRYKCYYTVKDKPENNCEGDECNSCDQYIEAAGSLCKKEDKVFYRDLYMQDSKDILATDYKKKWNECASKLLENDNKVCCDYVGEASNGLNDSNLEHYNRVCKGDNNNCPDGNCGKCKGWDLLACVSNNNTICERLKGTQTSGFESNQTGQAALIKNNGGLEFYTKVVSNYDLFPNGVSSEDSNWQGTTSGNEARDENNKPVKQNIISIIGDIESKGDSIYDDDPEYYIELNSACMSKIKEYNNHQEINDLGFGDYTGGIENLATRKYRSEFLKDLETNSEYQDCAKMIQNNLD